MTVTWRAWLASLAVGADAGHLVLIGCGSRQTLVDAAATPFSRIIVFDPEPEVGADLSAIARDDDRIEVRAAAVGAKPGIAAFSVFNWRAFSGLRAPDQAKSLLPGLRERRKVEVTVTTLSRIVQEFSISPSGHNVLRVCASAVTPVMEDLVSLENPYVFRDIFAEMPRDPAFEGDATAEQLLETLSRKRIIVNARADSDPEFPDFWLTVDTRSLESELLEGQAMAARGELDRSRKVFEQTRTELEERLKVLSDERDTLMAESKSRAAQLDDMTKVRDERAAAGRREKEELEARLEKATKSFNDRDAAAKRELADLKARLDEVTKERDTFASDLDRLRQEMQDALDEARSATSVAVRMQALRDADLRDLQGRYARTIEERDSQAALLQALTMRLSEAEDYLNQISLEQNSDRADAALLKAEGAASEPGGAVSEASGFSGESQPVSAKRAPRSGSKGKTKRAGAKRAGAKRGGVKPS